MRSQGIASVARALNQSTDHILEFFNVLRWELGFYVGCLNLRDHLVAKGQPLCFPQPLAPGEAMLSAHGLYDPCLSLSVKQAAVGNDVRADGKLLMMITGQTKAANRRSFEASALPN